MLFTPRGCALIRDKFEMTSLLFLAKELSKYGVQVSEPWRPILPLSLVSVIVQKLISRDERVGELRRSRSSFQEGLHIV